MTLGVALQDVRRVKHVEFARLTNSLYEPHPQLGAAAVSQPQLGAAASHPQLEAW